MGAQKTFYRIEYVLRQKNGLLYRGVQVTVTSLHPKEWAAFKGHQTPEYTLSMLSSQRMSEEEARMYEIELRNAIIAQGKALPW